MVVAEFKTSNGVSVSILDDAYRDKSEEELARIRRAAQVTAWRIWEKNELRKQKGAETT